MFPRFRNATFLFCKFFVLKIGPDWGIFSRANIRGKDSLRHELPHTRNPGLVRATVHSGGSFWSETSKLPGDRVVGVWGGFFSQFFYFFFVCFKTSICKLNKASCTSK